MVNYLTENKIERTINMALLAERNGVSKESFKKADKLLSVLREYYNMPYPDELKESNNKTILRFNESRDYLQNKSLQKKLSKKKYFSL